MSLDFNDLFEFSNPGATRPLWLTIAEPTDQGVFQMAYALGKGELRLGRSLELEATMGGQTTDFLWCAFVAVLCISQRVVTLLQEHSITGWATYPVIVRGRRGEFIPGYAGLSILGRAGDWDRRRSQIVMQPAPTPTGKPREAYKGIYFDEESWDGSDVFLAGGTRIVTTRVRDIFRRANVSNVRLTPLPEVEVEVALDKYG